MSMDIPAPKSTVETLPDHIAIGLLDESSQVVDEFIVDAHLRLAREDEVIPTDASISETVESIKSAVAPVIPDTERQALSPDEKDARRAQIIAQQQRRRKFGRPILRFDAIQYPTRH